MKILLIEDDLDLGNGIRLVLVDQGMDMVWMRMLADAANFLNAGLAAIRIHVEALQHQAGDARQ